MAKRVRSFLRFLNPLVNMARRSRSWKPSMRTINGCLPQRRSSERILNSSSNACSTVLPPTLLTPTLSQTLPKKVSHFSNSLVLSLSLSLSLSLTHTHTNNNNLLHAVAEESLSLSLSLSVFICKAKQRSCVAKPFVS